MAIYTQDQYDNLVAAIAQGALSCMYGNKQVQFRSLDDMLRIKKLMEDDLGISPKPASNRKYGTFSKGLQ
jgi:hypothetical protein